jgi:alkylhydroperoxidase family enzyme
VKNSDKILEDPSMAEPPLAAMLLFIKKMTQEPDALGPADMALLREAGLSDGAIRDGIQVCTLFNIINRVADALDFEIPPDALVSKMSKMLLKRGYKL